MSEQLPDRFYARVWLHWVSLLIFCILGLFSTVFGTLFWTGIMRDANNQLRLEAGPPMVIIGSLMLMAGINSLFNLWQRFKPTIQCYSDGIECRVSNASTLDRAWYLPALLRALWMVISLRALRYQRVWVDWKDFYCAQVEGRPMEYFLMLYGEWQTETQQAFGNYTFTAQVDLQLDPHEVAKAINMYARSAELREAVLQLSNRKS